jgi:hypothetical protein
MKKIIKNQRNGHHFNSKFWQTYKSNLPPLPNTCFDIGVGMLLGDATMYHVSREAYIKFEQGWKQKAFVYHLFDMFCVYCFMAEPSKRYSLLSDKKDKKEQTIKSYWFKTFSSADFTRLYNLFYEKIGDKRRKCVKKGLIINHLTPRGLAYWIMCDGSLQKDGKTLILHTQGFDLSENTLLSFELNQKFNLCSQVKKHKQKYYVIEIPKQDYAVLYNLVSEYMIPTMRYKIEKLK